MIRLGKPTADPQTERRSDLTALLDLTRSELDRVDHKAEILFTGSGVATGAIIGGALAGQWSPPMLTPFDHLIWWIAVGTWTTGLGCLAAAVYPRTGPGRTHGEGPMLAYYLDVARLPAPADLRAALEHGREPPDVVLIDQLFRVSKLVRAKYRCLKASLWLLVLAAGCATLTLTLH
jgi:hypothetical protein